MLCPLRLPDLGSRRFLCTCPSPGCPSRLRLPFLGEFRGADLLSIGHCMSVSSLLPRLRPGRSSVGSFFLFCGGDTGLGGCIAFTSLHSAETGCMLGAQWVVFIKYISQFPASPVHCAGGRMWRPYLLPSSSQSDLLIVTTVLTKLTVVTVPRVLPPMLSVLKIAGLE